MHVCIGASNQPLVCLQLFVWLTLSWYSINFSPGAKDTMLSVAHSDQNCIAASKLSPITNSPVNEVVTSSLNVEDEDSETLVQETAALLVSLSDVILSPIKGLQSCAECDQTDVSFLHMYVSQHAWYTSLLYTS